MKQFYLAEIATKDKLIHQGIFYPPSSASRRTTAGKAILWVHGLTDNFYGDLPALEALIERCEIEGWGLASFNTRGHDIVASVKKLDPQHPKGQISVSLGSSYENFADCVYDIDGAMTFLKKQGFLQVILAGISTGANKVCYYAGTQKDPRIAGVILLSPISDVPIESKSRQYKENVKQMKTLVKQRKGESLLSNISYLPLTPKRYLSLFDPGGIEDVFDYYSKQPKLTVFSCIKKPVCVVLAGADEYADRPVLDILNVLQKHHRSTNFQGFIIPNAFHSFNGQEQKVVDTVFRWAMSL